MSEVRALERLARPPGCEFCGKPVKPTGHPDGMLWMRCCSDACQDALDVRSALSADPTCRICGGIVVTNDPVCLAIECQWVANGVDP